MVIRKLSVIISLVFFVTISLGYPQSPSLHNKRTQTFNHVLLISIDGLHQKDVDVFTTSNPNSNLASILKNSVYFTNAQAALPTDSFPGLLAQLTGGLPKTTGVWYDNSWDGTFFAPGSKCKGSPGLNVVWDESLDVDQTVLNTTINQDLLPLRIDEEGECVKVQPWQYLRVNTVFEVAKKHGLKTAWVDKLPAYSIVNGPSGKGVDDFYGPEIASLPDKTNLTQVEPYDNYHTVSILNWIDGKTHDGKPFSVPNIFGGNFQSLSVAQKSSSNVTGFIGGYVDANATPADQVKNALNYIDGILGKFINELKTKNLHDDTIIVISAKHGQSPIDRTLFKKIDPQLLNDTIGADKLNQITTDDVALIWLKNHSDSKTAADSLSAKKDVLGIAEIFEGDSLKAKFGCDPNTDTRCPDIAIRVVPGVVYTTSKKKIAEHGGFNEDDYHVPIIVYNPSIQQKVANDAVETRYIAPFILSALGLDPNELDAVVKEKTPTLPVF
ncbi:3538_t:CDS:2 [Racocetra persica]|uniref:3538_t:CDS:1 n=1 Tax=Racocetra persica TaxID=160502 RepID=A0ACA9QD84_9GLOM|nr:3538_t:CDS:2 [Racocetra persica]